MMFRGKARALAPLFASLGVTALMLIPQLVAYKTALAVLLVILLGSALFAAWDQVRKLTGGASRKRPRLLALLFGGVAAFTAWALVVAQAPASADDTQTAASSANLSAAAAVLVAGGSEDYEEYEPPDLEAIAHSRASVKTLSGGEAQQLIDKAKELGYSPQSGAQEDWATAKAY